MVHQKVVSVSAVGGLAEVTATHVMKCWDDESEEVFTAENNVGLIVLGLRFGFKVGKYRNVCVCQRGKRSV